MSGPTTTALTNIRTSYQVAASAIDQHGVKDTSSEILKSGYGWDESEGWVGTDAMSCLACHKGSHVAGRQNLFQLKDLVKSRAGDVNIPSDNAGLNYELTDNNIKNPTINGFEWCNTCHVGSMGDKKDNCFSCHNHGDGRF